MTAAARSDDVPGAPFAIRRPQVGPVPLLVHVPHASVAIPPDVRAGLLLDDDELAAELLRLTDAHTDRLFAPLLELGATLFVNGRSRLVVDPERFVDDTVEPAAAVGQGVVYTHGSRGQRIRADDPVARAALIADVHEPYHAALTGLVAEQLTAFGGCTIVDAHSFPTAPLPSESGSGTGLRPQVCIGTHAPHSPAALVERLETGFGAHGYDVARDHPYVGTFVPTRWLGVDPRVRSVMLEIRRDAYLDESTGAPSDRFGAVASDIELVVAEAVLERS